MYVGDEMTGQDRTEERKVWTQNRPFLKDSKYQGILSYPFTDSKSTLSFGLGGTGTCISITIILC